MADQWVVCEFNEDDGKITVEVVHSKWLSSDLKRTLFPPLNRYKICVKKGLVDESWKSYEVKVLTSFFSKFFQLTYNLSKIHISLLYF